jgi:deoxyribodipyrimidine photolyase-related protein
MSNFCQSCRYDPEDSLSPDACPFNALYWDFIDRNQARLDRNQRMATIYASWRRMSGEKQQATRDKARDILTRLEQGRL